jgi:phospholipid/cholesterol/gamma-HCH transport system permease protein
MRSNPILDAKERRKPTSHLDAKFIEVKRDGDQTTVFLEGEWTVENAGLIEREIEATCREWSRGDPVISAKAITKLDTSGAMLLKKLLPEKEKPHHLEGTQRALIDFLPTLEEYKHPEKRKPPLHFRFFGGIGEKIFDGLRFLRALLVFVGRISERLAWNVLHPRSFRVPSIVRHVEETGIQALPIIGLLAVLISMVITYQGSIQLRKFGAEIYTIDLTVISLLREMGVLMTAIMVAGRSGSAFTAEIGVMTMRDEVNALKTIGLNPIEVLVLPRVLALLITLPCLTFLADIIGLAGNCLMSSFLLNTSVTQYLARVQAAADVNTFFVGMIKAPVFALLIAVIGCYQGLNVTRSAESVGRKTTLSVVQAIFLVIMADAFFSIIFSSFGV